MNLDIHVGGRVVGTLAQVGDFRSVMHYRAGVAPEDLVSLTMRVRAAPYEWDDVLHPVFQMNLPEGYLLQVLQEQFGPHVGASPTALLSVIGRNMIGRMQVAPPGAALDAPAAPIDVAALLRGDNAEEAFAALVRRHATSGVSGVVPKFLDTGEEHVATAPHRKATIVTHRHIIKGSSRLLPFISLNEHLCMAVVRRVMPAATTEVSDDGNALVVHRFDVDEDGVRHHALEDFCALLGMRPAQKYETTWERIGRATRDHVPEARRRDAFDGLATTLLLTYALRNADCHAKNVALRYTRREDAHLAPAYDVVTTAAYPEYADNPPAIGFMGRKTWAPGKALATFIGSTFDLAPRDQSRIVESIADAVSDVAPSVREAMARHAGFREIGARMLACWSQGVAGLRDARVYALPAKSLGAAFDDVPAAKRARRTRDVTGRSEGLAKRR